MASRIPPKGLLSRRRLLAGVGTAASAAVAGRPAQSRQDAVDTPMPALQRRTVEWVDRAAEPLARLGEEDFASVVDRYAEAKVILLGESTHGTDEF